MSRMQYFLDRVGKMDKKAMWKTTGILKKRSGKSRAWLMKDMLSCAVKYNAGYMDYKIAQMYKLNDEQRSTVITRGISNDIVRRMNNKEYWHYFDDKAEFNEQFKEWIPRKWIVVKEDTDPDELYALCRNQKEMIWKPLEGSSGQGIRKYHAGRLEGRRGSLQKQDVAGRNGYSGRSGDSTPEDGIALPHVGEHLPDCHAAGRQTAGDCVCFSAHRQRKGDGQRGLRRHGRAD